MLDVTELINKYRECARHLWNAYFLEQMTNSKDWDLSDEYEEICRSIFSSLVLRPVDQLSFKKSFGYEARPQPIPFLRVLPVAEMPIEINREVPCSGYWDYPLNMIKPADADLSFIDFYDFNSIGFRDFRYCRVRIYKSEKYPEIEGRDALLESDSVRIFADI